jgi:ABC-type spermidine/putrescine transport system permease subunit I
MTLRQDRLVAAGFVLPAALFTAAVFLVPLWNVLVQSVTNPAWTLAGYRSLLGSTLFWRVLQNTIEISVISTFVAFLLAYPMAYHLSRQTPRRRVMFLMLVMLPFWTSILVKSYAFMVLLGRTGILNSMLQQLGLPNVQLLFNRTGVVIGTVHSLIPFILFPILTSLLAQDPALPKAAQVMGAGGFRIFRTVTFPLSLPGVVAGCVLALVHTLGFYVTAALLGGKGDMMVASLVDMYTREILNWTLASAIAVTLLVLCSLVALLAARSRALAATLRAG